MSINEKSYAYGASKSSIREIFAYGMQRKAEVGAENVYDFSLGNPSIPAPDEVRGQVVKASIVLTKDTEGTEELKKEIQRYVKEKTAPYKYPRIVVFRSELPKTTSGKIQRNLL